MLFEEMMRDEFKAGKAEGIAEGEAKGKVELLAELVALKKAKGLPVSQIAAELEQEVAVVEKLYQEA